MNLNSHKQDLLSKGLLHIARSRRHGHRTSEPPSEPQTLEVARSWPKVVYDARTALLQVFGAQMEVH